MSLKNLGLCIIIVSFLPWATIIFVVPFLQIDLAHKAALVTILAVVAEVLFWLGLVRVGKELATKYRRYLSFSRLWKSLKKLLR